MTSRRGFTVALVLVSSARTWTELTEDRLFVDGLKSVLGGRDAGRLSLNSLTGGMCAVLRFGSIAEMRPWAKTNARSRATPKAVKGSSTLEVWIFVQMSYNCAARETIDYHQVLTSTGLDARVNLFRVKKDKESPWHVTRLT
jgi:hypothetical protein